MSLKLITASSDLPFTVEEAKQHLRFSSNAEDGYIGGLILAARILCENETSRTLLPQTLEMSFHCFSDRLWLRRPPVIEIVSVKYLAPTGVEQTLSADNYVLDDSSDTVIRLALAPGKTWPSVYLMENNVKIRYTAGYADAASIPEPLKRWMLAQVGHWFRNRESINIGNITSKLDNIDFLLNGYRTEAGL